MFAIKSEIDAMRCFKSSIMAGGGGAVSNITSWVRLTGGGVMIIHENLVNNNSNCESLSNDSSTRHICGSPIIHSVSLKITLC